MQLRQAIKPISYIKAHAADVIRELNEQHGTMIITQHGEAKAVIQDITEYERIQEALALLKMVAQGQKDFEEGKTIPAKKLLKEFDDMISKDFPKK
jgi:prevent-host-death family protein